MITINMRSAFPAATCGLVAVLVAIAGAQPPAAPVQTDDYGYDTRYFTPQEREGRDTWYFWTGGNEHFWVEMNRITDGNVSLLNYVDSRRHGRRFRELGAITQPGCEAATAPDQYGLWMDRCNQPPVPGIPGEPSGIVGLRKFPNPKFDASRWNAEKYLQHPEDVQPPYLIGMTCGFCHIGYNPINPARRSRAPHLGQSGRDDRQPVLGGRKALQPQHEAGRLPLACRRTPAARHLGYVAFRHRSHQQPERDQHDLQPRRHGRRRPNECGTARPCPCTTSSRTAKTRSASRGPRSGCT